MFLKLYKIPLFPFRVRLDILIKKQSIMAATQLFNFPPAFLFISVHYSTKLNLASRAHQAV